ncbi:hypothetical protein TIFTF001_029152 [Ficus carica]|uniref:Uncharacterized protein n=1 Tax=Ficus carica TaxID=3494 RepID=A0AA88DRM1_FICCA|nr:hypothetical protein TIFTF001_029152 [Ficus carica]
MAENQSLSSGSTWCHAEDGARSRSSGQICTSAASKWGWRNLSGQDCLEKREKEGRLHDEESERGGRERGIMPVKMVAARMAMSVKNWW